MKERISSKKIKNEEENICFECRKEIVDFHLNAADHNELERIGLKVSFLNESPCNTEYCKKQCSIKGQRA